MRLLKLRMQKDIIALLSRLAGAELFYIGKLRGRNSMFFHMGHPGWRLTFCVHPTMRVVMLDKYSSMEADVDRCPIQLNTHPPEAKFEAYENLLAGLKAIELARKVKKL